MKDKIIIIGGGPAGLAAALEANAHGVSPDDILILERDSTLGGILNQCIHAGFGLHLFGEEMSGPEYAGRFIREVEEKGIGYRCDSMALSVSPDLFVTYVSPKDGFVREKASAVILATGCRERTRGAIGIAGTRPSGIFTAGSAQRFVNIEGQMPGKRVVILGSGDIGLIMARRMTLEGAKVECVCEVMPYSGGLGRNIAQCLDDFGIPLYLSHTVTEILGRDRVTGVKICEVDENRRPIPSTEKIVECDTLLLSVGLIPENELAKGADIKLDRVTGGAIVDQENQTSVCGIFACGNALQVHDLVDFVTLEARSTGRHAAEYAMKTDSEKQTQTVSTAKTSAGQHVRYVVPQLLRLDSLSGENAGETKLFFRSDNIYRDVKLVVSVGDKIVKTVKKRIVTPGEMENIALDGEMVAALKADAGSSLTVSLQ